MSAVNNKKPSENNQIHQDVLKDGKLSVTHMKQHSLIPTTIHSTDKYICPCFHVWSSVHTLERHKGRARFCYFSIIASLGRWNSYFRLLKIYQYMTRRLTWTCQITDRKWVRVTGKNKTFKGQWFFLFNISSSGNFFLLKIVFFYKAYRDLEANMITDQTDICFCIIKG